MQRFPYQEAETETKILHFQTAQGISFSGIDLLAILKKNLNRTTFVYILKNFRMCIIAIEALTPLHRSLRIKMYKNIARSRLFCRMAKRSIFHSR